MFAPCVFFSLVLTFEGQFVRPGASVENTDLVQVRAQVWDPDKAEAASVEAALVGATDQTKGLPFPGKGLAAAMEGLPFPGQHKTEATPAPTPEVGPHDSGDLLDSIAKASAEADKIGELRQKNATAPEEAGAGMVVPPVAPGADMVVAPVTPTPDGADMVVAPVPPTPNVNFAANDTSNGTGNGTGNGTVPTGGDTISHRVDDAARQAVIDAVRENMGAVDGVQARIGNMAVGDDFQNAVQKIVAEIPVLAAAQLRKSLEIGGFSSEQLRVMTPEQQRAALKELLEERPTQELLNSLSLDATSKTLDAMEQWKQLRNQAVQNQKASSVTGYVSHMDWTTQTYG